MQENLVNIYLCLDHMRKVLYGVHDNLKILIKNQLIKIMWIATIVIVIIFNYFEILNMLMVHQK